ncbi:MAG: hypothetical protein ABI831_10320 [Betaproteobacteria bacterium]
MRGKLPPAFDTPSYHAGESMVDVNDGNSVLDFMYAYLRKQQVAPSDDEVRNVSVALAQYQGPPLVTDAALEAFLARTG